MESFSSVIACLCGSDDDYQRLNAAPPPPRAALDARHATTPGTSRPLTGAEKQAVKDIVAILRTAAIRDSKIELAREVDDTVTAQGGWKEWIAEGVLNGIKLILEEASEKMGEAMKVAHERSVEAADAVFRFTKEHPVAAAGLLTIVAIGVLVILAPVVVEALGFAELGPLEGSFASWWESTYAGYIPKGSLFSFFQRLGMLWGKA